MLPMDTQLKNQIAATKLVIEGMRIPLVHALTGLSCKQLSYVWKSAQGDEATLSGRGATGVISFLKRSLNKNLHISLSTIAEIYFSLEKSHPRLTHAEVFLLAWQSRSFFLEADEEIDINVVWYAIRDIKTTELHLSRCARCHSSFLYDLKIEEISHCPFCKK